MECHAVSNRKAIKTVSRGKGSDRLHVNPCPSNNCQVNDWKSGKRLARHYTGISTAIGAGNVGSSPTRWARVSLFKTKAMI